MKKAVILLSGGLDSATVCAIAKKEGYDIHTVSFIYGQRHDIELDFSKKIVDQFNIKNHKIINIDLASFGGSALVDKNLEVPKNQDVDNQEDIPITYVPARNLIFLSFALAYSETIKCSDIFIGVNAVDYSNYPDCRMEFIKSFQDVANKGTAANLNFEIHAPLIYLNKAEIIKKGIDLGVDYAKSHSCYDPVEIDGKFYACGKCDSCLLRLKGFKENNIKDPYPYIK